MGESEPVVRDEMQPLQLRPIVAAAIVAALGPVLWVGSYTTLGAAWLPPLVIGACAGLAVRLTIKRPDGRLGVIAVLLTLASCFAGYIWTDMAFIQWADQTYVPTFGDALRRFLNDIVMLVVIAFGAYLSYLIAAPQRS